MTLPNDPTRNALIRRPSTDLTTISTGDRIVSRMVGEALEIARRQAIQAAKRTIKLGHFDLCEPDYRQIVRWAKALDREPADLLVELSELTWDLDDELSARFRIEGGSIKELAWDGDLLPIENFEWEAGLEIEVLYVQGPLPSISQLLPSLRVLNVSGRRRRMDDLARTVNLTELDLSSLPGLTRLDCSSNQLTELDLSLAPGLTELYCSSNRLTKLDLSPVPGLRRLWCGSNELTKLDLSKVTSLTTLDCGNNQLTELDLSPVPGLTELDCGGGYWLRVDRTDVRVWVPGNQLTELDLSPVPGLTWLKCGDNQLTELDLSPVPGLTELYCVGNLLTKLDISLMTVLTVLDYDQNHMSECPGPLMDGFIQLICRNDQLTQLGLCPGEPYVILTSDDSVHTIRESN